MTYSTGLNIGYSFEDQPRGNMRVIFVLAIMATILAAAVFFRQHRSRTDRLGELSDELDRVVLAISKDSSNGVFDFGKAYRAYQLNVAVADLTYPEVRGGDETIAYDYTRITGVVPMDDLPKYMVRRSRQP